MQIGVVLPQLEIGAEAAGVRAYAQAVVFDANDVAAWT